MAKERVQVQGLGDVAPGIQPTIQRAGQYGIQVQKAGRNKLMDLADALGQINPVLQQYGNIRKLEQQRKQKLEEALREEGYRAFKTDPATMAVELEKTQQKIRAAVERGEIPNEANSARIVGALKAKAEVLAKRDYRNILNNPEILLTTKDPVVEALQQREKFFNREEFQSPIVRDHAIKFFEEVENEFINTVEKRLAAFEVEEGKGFWLEKGRPAINQIISGQLDVNDETVKTWLNDPAGLFQGSRKYAWDNLISETLNEGLSKDPSEEGSISPQQAEKFLDKLRTLDLGGGVKFADAEVGNSITSYYDKINDKRSKWEARKNEQLKTQYETNKGVLTNLLFEAMGDGNTVPTEDARKLKAAFLQQTPLQYDAQASADFESILKSINQPSDDASKLVVGSFDTLIAEGEDLTRVEKDIDKAFSSNSISAKERLTLLNKIESERDFDKLVHKTEGVRKLSESYEELITGFRSMRIGKATYEDSYFAQLGIPEDLEPNDRQDPKKNGSIFSQIANTKGGYEAKRFVNNRYYAFQKYFRQANLFKFKEYEADPETTPQEAANKVLEEMRETATEVFKVWENESIREAQRLYKIVVYKKAEDIPEPKF